MLIFPRKNGTRSSPRPRSTARRLSRPSTFPFIWDYPDPRFPVYLAYLCRDRSPLLPQLVMFKAGRFGRPYGKEQA